MLKDWHKSIICPIYNEGDKLICKNYQGISFLCTIYKVFTTILQKRLMALAKTTIGEYQSGFRTGRSTTDQLFMVKQILNKCWEFDRDVYHLYVAFRKAYDSILRDKLYNIMLGFGIPSKLVGLTKMTMTETLAQVRIQNELTELFELTQGLKQGSGWPFSCLTCL